jgi:hypothetical protein
MVTQNEFSRGRWGNILRGCGGFYPVRTSPNSPYVSSSNVILEANDRDPGICLCLGAWASHSDTQSDA